MLYFSNELIRIIDHKLMHSILLLIWNIKAVADII